jgi:tetratricopeptide (TPR) repeat protein/DNA-binding CsgD family transcriptional regulator
MTIEEIEELLQEAEHSLKNESFSDAERYVDKIITSFISKDPSKYNEDVNYVLLISSAYRIFSESLWKRGFGKDSIPLAEKAHSLALSVNSKFDIAKTAFSLGNSLAISCEYHRAISFFNLAITEYIEIGNERQASIVIGNVGNIYFNTCDYEKAILYYQKSLALHDKYSMKQDYARVLGNLGMVNIALGNYTIALQHLKSALDMHQELNMKTDTARVLGNIGCLYNYISDFNNAKFFHKKAIQLYTELGNNGEVAACLGNIASTHAYLQEYESAIECYTSSIIMHENLGNQSSAAIVYGNLAKLYFVLKDYENAFRLVHKVLKMQITNISKNTYVSQIYLLGKIYLDVSSYIHNEKLAEQHLLKALNLSGHYGLKSLEQDIYLSLATLYKQEHRWEEYAEHIEKYHQLYIEVQNEEVKKQADRFGWERKVIEMEKEKEIEKIKNEADKKILEETINFQKLSIEQQSRELKNTIEELVRKNTLLQHIQSDIKKIAPHTIREGTEHIKHLLDRVERNITPLESNQQLHNQLNEIHKDFMRNLHEKFPDLTIMELKIAALLSMKLTSSNIAAALFLSKRTVESHRLSLRKKCGIGKDDNIYEELSKYMV